MNSKVILLFICLNLVLVNCSFLDKIGDKMKKLEDGAKKAEEKVKNWEHNVGHKIGQAKDKVKDWFGHLHENDQKHDENTTGGLSDEKRTTPELIESRGFKYEEHQVTTEDGYILKIFRIVNPHKDSDKVIFLQHGISRSSDDWLINSEGGLDSKHNYRENGGSLLNHCQPKGSKTAANTLGFVLSDCGYDVWLGNSRGNSYSYEHKTLNSSDPKSDYWKYSFQQMGQYDLPAVIDYVLNQTNKDSLALIAHSQGTSQTFAMLSEDEEHANKVNTFIALAPVVYFDNFNPLEFEPVVGMFLTPQVAQRAAKVVQEVQRSNPGPSDNRNSDFTSLVSDSICHIMKHFGPCGDSISGKASKYNNKTRESVYTGHSNRASKWCSAHYAQLISSLNFEKFQYNDDETPEEYNLYDIDSSKIALFYSDKDILTNDDNMKRLKNALQSNHRTLLEDYKVPCSEWTHLDYIKAKDTGKCINSKILHLLDSRK